MFQPFLRFKVLHSTPTLMARRRGFQPFLRFKGSCVWLLCVFKFFFGFCLFGGRLGTTLYIHFIRRWVKSRRRSSASRRKKRGEEAEKNAILRSWRLGVGQSTRRTDPVDHLSLPHVLDKPPLAQCVYRLSDGGDCAPPSVYARRRRGRGAFHHLHSAYLGEYVQPPPRKVEGEA